MNSVGKSEKESPRSRGQERRGDSTLVPALILESSHRRCLRDAAHLRVVAAKWGHGRRACELPKTASVFSRGRRDLNPGPPVPERCPATATLDNGRPLFSGVWARSGPRRHWPIRGLSITGDDGRVAQADPTDTSPPFPRISRSAPLPEVPPASGQPRIAPVTPAHAINRSARHDHQQASRDHDWR